MATDQQVALARQPRLGPPAQISKNARHVVPAFLQKLYEMVNDPKNAELIRWSEAGDSFFVLDHERFAHEVLGRWFKHRNFASFVRQLNMYGFHKIPHLQQGVLKSDNDTEFWNFAHTNFHRNQPDLLCFIQRKKQAAQPGDDVAMDMRDPGAAVPAAATLSSGQILDIHSIVNGITAIKRHQTTISAELNELKRSNQLLWQDAMAARTRHQKQQDTINRIVKFLAGVFGQHAANHKDDGVESPQPHSVIPRRTRLMIEDTRRDEKGKIGVVQLEDQADESMYGISNAGTNTTTPPTTGESKNSVVDRLLDWLSTSGYPIVETPKSAASPAPSVTSETPSSYFSSVYISTNPVQPPTEDAVHTPSESSATTATTNVIANNTNDLQYPQQPQTIHHHVSIAQSQPQQSSMHSTQAVERTVTPSRHVNGADNGNSSNLNSNNNVGYDYDPRVQTILNQLSPLQIQQLLSSLAAAQAIPDPLPDPPMMEHDPSQSAHPSASSTAHHLTPYQPSPFDFMGVPAASMDPGAYHLHAQQQQQQQQHLPPAPDGLISFDQYDPRMERSWQATEDIDKDVNLLNSSINQLIATFGLDPTTIENGPEDGVAVAALMGGAEGMQHTGGSGAVAGMGIDDEVGALPPVSAGTDGEFDFDSFLNTLPAAPAEGGMDYSDMPSTAFLDEVVPSPSDGSPIAHVRPLSPERSTVIGRKRKSDVSELDIGKTTDTPSLVVPGTGTGKPKRRKDK